MTYHSICRTIERVGLSNSKAMKLIFEARENGLTSSEFPYREKEYLEKKSIDGKVALYYKGFCFIFEEKYTCITMFRVPSWFGKNIFLAE